MTLTTLWVCRHCGHDLAALHNCGEGVTLDIDQSNWEAIQQAVSRNTWMPPEYVQNDWMADILRYLEFGPTPTSAHNPRIVRAPN